MAFRLLQLLVLLLLPLTVGASDRPPQYFGLSLGDYDLTADVDGDEVTAGVTNVGLHGGYRFSRFFALEGRLGYSRTSSSELGERPDLVLGGGFARVDLPFDRVSLYGLLGASTIGYDVGDGNKRESGVSGGVGVEIYGTPRTALNLEYVSHAAGDYEGIGIGVIHHFNWPSLRQ